MIYTARGVELTLKHCPLLPCIPHRKALPCHPDIVPSYREANQYPVEGVVCMRPSNRLRSAQKGPWASSSATPTLPRLRAPLARPAHLAAGQSWSPGAPFQAGEVLLPTAGPSFLCRLLHPIRVTIPGCVSVASRWPAKAWLWPLLTGETCEQAAQPSAEPSLASECTERAPNGSRRCKPAQAGRGSLQVSRSLRAAASGDMDAMLHRSEGSLPRPLQGGGADRPVGQGLLEWQPRAPWSKGRVLTGRQPGAGASSSHPGPWWLDPAQ